MQFLRKIYTFYIKNIIPSLQQPVTHMTSQTTRNCLNLYFPAHVTSFQTSPYILFM